MSDRETTQALSVADIVGRISAAVATLDPETLVRLNLVTVGLVEVPEAVRRAVAEAAHFIWRVKDACERGAASELARGDA